MFQKNTDKLIKFQLSNETMLLNSIDSLIQAPFQIKTRYFFYQYIILAQEYALMNLRVVLRFFSFV